MKQSPSSSTDLLYFVLRTAWLMSSQPVGLKYNGFRAPSLAVVDTCVVMVMVPVDSSAPDPVLCRAGDEAG